ncbi:MAG: hypothetical protein HY852_27595 [Bradyrhizobium sp.]|uniref:hypothetical protein n=1 Tax=Bradyrhizobium sp. TaxID=376 RepID=UPI0025BA8E00|nr:hypothetical protein [Bradyrhizobium sp.]MBI5265576.1 hypothetical protein [Bradyrhizobium sp.]
MIAALALLAALKPARAEQVILIDRASPERKPMLDAVRAPVEQRLGIRVIFVVERLAVSGDWAFAEVHPRTEAGARINYRQTRYARNYIPDQDSDLVLALLRRAGRSWVVVQEAFLPTDVVWEDWVKTYRLPRRLFLDQ